MYLNCKTFFSLLYGTIKTEDLVLKAAAYGIKMLALTNINTTSDAWDFTDHCEKNHIQPILGAEIRNESLFCYILLAKNNAGFFQINRFLSEHLQSKKAFPERYTGDDENVFVIYPFGKFAPETLGLNERIGIQTTELNKLYGFDPEAYPDKFVIRHPVTFQDKKHYNVHRLLRAVDKNILLSKQQQEDVAGLHEMFISPLELSSSFDSYPGIVDNTTRMMQCCTIDMEFRKNKTKKVYSMSAEDDRTLLEKLALDGLAQRYGNNNPQAKERVEKELRIIHQMGFNAYFLITWDILRYARNRGFFYVGRGSGANSIVAFCLEITDVDPLDLDLYFERFLNPHRSVPPDFDIDFSWADRDQIIDYVFKRFGSEHVCLLGSYSTFQRRAIIRELGKVFGLPKGEIDALEHPSGNYKQDKIHEQILFYSGLIKDFPHHQSIHAGGMLISDAPVHEYTTTTLPPKGFATSTIDMFVAEKIGLFKLDILSQRGLGHIKDTVELVRQNRQVNIDIHDIKRFKKDKKVAAQLMSVDTIGCFYIESPGMRQLLLKLECRDYLTLVAASSIIRPGVAQSGMMRQYIQRYHRPKDFVYLHPIMKELLEETYGVMVYQEDVIKVAHHFAGLELGDADVLRRAMSGKYRGMKEFDAIRNQFFTNCRQKGYEETLIVEVWRQIESFGGFSFSKAHSASFAVESYQSLFLKTYYPQEFMVAVINNFGGFYSREVYFHELKKTGAQLVPPCVNEGHYLTSIRNNIVHVGFIHVEGLEEKLVARILEEKGRHGSYFHLQDLIERTDPPLEQLNLLIRIGALRFTGKNKKELLWEANFLQKKTTRQVAGHVPLFNEPPVEFKLPQLKQHPLNDAMDEMELLGFPLCNVWDLADADTSRYITASELKSNKGKSVNTAGYFITDKVVRTVRGDNMHFGTFLDKRGEWLDTVHFPGSFRYTPFQGRGFYELTGTVVEEFGVYSIEVEHCNKLGIKSW